MHQAAQSAPGFDSKVALASPKAPNLPPASVFLGDAGSMLTGLVVGTLGIQASLKGPATVALVAPISGRLSDRLDSRMVTLAFGCLLAFVLPWLAVMPSVWTLALTVCAFGGGMGGLDVAMNALATVVQRRRGTTIMASFHAASGTNGIPVFLVSS